MTYQTDSGGTRVHLPMLWLAFALFLALLAYVGPAFEDHGDEQAQADSLQDAMKVEEAAVRQAEAIAARCGANSAWADMGGGWAQCFDKRGRKTMRVAMVQP